MVSSNAQTVKAYLAGLPEDRRKALSAIRKVVKANLPKGYKEGMQYGMIGYYIPFSRYPDTYNGQPLGVIALGSQKRHMAIYLMSVYGNPKLETWFKAAFAKAGKKLNMGKSCVRFRKLEDIPLDVIGETVARVSVDDFIASYEAARAGTAAKKATKKAAKKKVVKKATKKKVVKKETKKKVVKKATKKKIVKKATKKKIVKKATEKATKKKVVKKKAVKRG